MAEIQKFVKAIRKGDIQSIGEFLQNSGFDPNSQDPKSGKTFLQIAIQNQEAQIFKLLLAHKGNDINRRSKQGDTCLQSAILVNNVDYVNAILHKNFNSKLRNGKGESIMHVAIRTQVNPEIIKKLIQHHFDVNQKIPEYGSLLHLAIIHNQFENFQYLLKQQQIQLRTLDDEGNTCLMVSARQKRGDFVMALFQKLHTDCLSAIEKQSFVNTQNEEGNSALHLAAINDHQTITDIILREGGKIGLDRQLKNKEGKTFEMIINDRSEKMKKEQMNEAIRREAKHIRNKEKQEERARRQVEEQRMRAEMKRRKREEEQALELQMQKSKQDNKNRSLLIVGVGFALLLVCMYLLLQNSIKSNPSSQAF